MPAEQRASSEVSVPSLWQTVRNTDWDPILNEYQSYLITIRQLANPTVRNYMNDLTAFMKFLDENDRIHQIGSPDRRQLRSYLAFLASLGYNKSSISRKLTALRTFFGWMQESGKVPKTTPTPLLHRANLEGCHPSFRKQKSSDCSWHQILPPR